MRWLKGLRGVKLLRGLRVRGLLGLIELWGLRGLLGLRELWGLRGLRRMRGLLYIYC